MPPLKLMPFFGKKKEKEKNCYLLILEDLKQTNAKKETATVQRKIQRDMISTC